MFKMREEGSIFAAGLRKQSYQMDIQQLPLGPFSFSFPVLPPESRCPSTPWGRNHSVFLLLWGLWPVGGVKRAACEQ